MATGVKIYISAEKCTSEGIQRDICCARCGASEESTNDVFFEYPPAVHVWTLSKIAI